MRYCLATFILHVEAYRGASPCQSRAGFSPHYREEGFLSVSYRSLRGCLEGEYMISDLAENVWQKGVAVGEANRLQNAQGNEVFECP